MALTGLRQAVGGCPCSQGLQQLCGGYRGAARPQAWLQWGDGHSAGILQLEHKFFTHLACSTHRAAGFVLWPAVQTVTCLAQSLPEGGSPRHRSLRHAASQLLSDFVAVQAQLRTHAMHRQRRADSGNMASQ